MVIEGKTCTDWFGNQDDVRKLRQLGDLAGLLAEAGTRLVKKKPHRAVYFVAGAAGEPGVYLKLFQPPTLRRKLKHALGITPASRECYIARTLLANGVPSVVPLGFLCLLRYGLPVASLAAFQELPDTVPFSDYLQSAAKAEREDLLAAYGDLIARMHLAGVYLKDLYMDNVLIGTADPHTLSMIDFESAVPWVGRLASRRQRNLMTAIFSGANPELSSSERRIIMEGYLKALRGTKYNASEVEHYLERVRRAAERYQARRQ